MEQVYQFLKSKGLSLTENRKQILDLFIRAEGALSPADIEKRIPTQLDRVTVYRTLQTFMEQGIIHQIPTTDNILRYALCKDDCDSGHHHDNHVHFVCESCGNTTCLDNVEVPVVKLPRGYHTSHAAMIIHGSCDDCAQ